MTSETRYFYYAMQTVNGTTAFKLMLNVDPSGSDYATAVGTSVTWGIRVWRIDVNGGYHEITSGTPVAQVNGLNNGLVSATWSCPQTALNPTDCIFVSLYYYSASLGEWLGGVDPSNNYTYFITDQAQNWNNGAGASQLNAATWTVEYYLAYSGPNKSGSYTFYCYWGTTSYETQIQNFSYSSVAAGVSLKERKGDGLTFSEVWA